MGPSGPRQSASGIARSARGGSTTRLASGGRPGGGAGIGTGMPKFASAASAAVVAPAAASVIACATQRPWAHVHGKTRLDC